MKKTILISLFLFVSSLCLAQVTGVFVTNDSVPIAGGTVRLLSSHDSAVVTSTSTNQQGRFKIENKKRGNYFIRFSAINFQVWNSPSFKLDTSDISMDIGKHVMKNEIQSLSEVTIQSRKSLLEQTESGIIVNVADGILNNGSSALEVLERSPGVLIDQRNNSISLNGKSGVSVMVDGKLIRLSMDQLITFLSGISANDMDKIALLTAPPSKYDAEGSSGMINIIMKKNKKAGASVSTSVTAGYGQGEKAAASLQMGHRTAKVNISSTYTYSLNRSLHQQIGESYQDFPPLGGPMTVVFRNIARPIRNIHDASVNLDVQLYPKMTIGAGLDYNTQNFRSASDNHRSITILPDSLLLFKGRVHAKSRSQNIRSSVYADRQISGGETFHIEFDYLNYKNSNHTNIQSTFINNNGDQAGSGNDTLFAPAQRGVGETLIRVGIGKLDYSKQWNKRLKLEAGLKGSFTNSSGFSRIESLVKGNWVGRGETTNNMLMREHIGAAYTAVHLSLDTASTLNIGFRYEYSHTNATDKNTEETTISRKLSALFPNISFSHKITEQEDWQVSYIKRIGRPSYNDLSSFVTYNDLFTVFTGNPLLKPTITQVIRAGYRYRDYSFSLSLSRDKDPIAQYQLTEAPQKNLMYISPQNVSFQHNIVFQSNLSHELTGWWTMIGNFVLGWRAFQENYTLYPVKKSFTDYSINWSNLFLLPGKLSIELSGFYNSPSYNGTVKTERFGAINLGIKKDLKNKGTLQLSITDLLGSIKYKSYYGTLTREAFDGSSYAIYNPESRKFPIIKLTYSISLGSKDKASQKNKEEMESKRISTD